MHESFIVSLVKAIEAKSYLELGLYVGDTFLEIEKIVDKAIGVDIKAMFTPKHGMLFIGTTSEFFESNSNTFDLIFIDADHSFESAKIDLVNSLDVLNPYGVIVMHDTDPTKEELLDQSYCGDSYRVVDWIVQSREDLNVVTLPLGDPGLSIVQRKCDRRVNRFV